LRATIAWWLRCTRLFLLENLKSVFPFGSSSGRLRPIALGILSQSWQREEKKNNDKT
jgi:hypothetical protein